MNEIKPLNINYYELCKIFSTLFFTSVGSFHHGNSYERDFIY